MIRKILFAAVIVSVLAAFAVLILGHRSPPPQTFRLPDGTVVTFGGVTYGVSNTFVWGRPFQKFLYKVLPAKFKAQSGCAVLSHSTFDTNNPVFWIHVDGPVQGGLFVRLLDEYGCEFDPQGWEMGTANTGRGYLCRYQITGMPPCGKTAGLCFYSYDQRTNKLGRFLIPGVNLLPVPISQVMPAPQSAGDLAVKLTRLTTGLTSIPEPYTKSTNSIPFSQAAFRITREGGQARGWHPTGIRITDAQGKKLRPKMIQHGDRNDEFILNFDSVLDPASGPFQLEVEFTHESNFSPDELVTLTRIPFPPIGGSTKPGVTADLQGETVGIDGIYAASSEHPKSSFGSYQPFIEASISPVSRGLHLQLVRARTGYGGELSYGGYAPMGNGKYQFGYEIPPRFTNGPDAKLIDLTFAVHRSRYVTFEATPVSFSTNAASDHMVNPAR